VETAARTEIEGGSLAWDHSHPGEAPSDLRYADAIGGGKATVPNAPQSCYPPSPVPGWSTRWFERTSGGNTWAAADLRTRLAGSWCWIRTPLTPSTQPPHYSVRLSRLQEARLSTATEAPFRFGSSWTQQTSRAEVNLIIRESAPPEEQLFFAKTTVAR